MFICLFVCWHCTLGICFCTSSLLLGATTLKFGVLKEWFMIFKNIFCWSAWAQTGNSAGFPSGVLHICRQQGWQAHTRPPGTQRSSLGFLSAPRPSWAPRQGALCPRCGLPDPECHCYHILPVKASHQDTSRSQRQNTSSVFRVRSWAMGGIGGGYI